MSRKRIPYIASLSSMSSRSTRGQQGDLGHAQPGGVVGQLDVAAQLSGCLVQRVAHDPEVLLGGVGAAVALGGGAVGHVVEQGLRGGADHRDDVGARLGGGPRLRDVVVDVAGGDDHVDPGPPGRVAPAGAPAVRARSWPGRSAVLPGDRGPPGTGGTGRVPRRRQPEADPAGRGLLRQRGEVRGLVPRQRVPHRHGDAVLEPDGVTHSVDEVVHPRHPLRVGPDQPGQAQGRALDRDRGVGAGQAHHRRRHPAGQPSRPADRRRIQGQRRRRRSPCHVHPPAQ